MCLMIITIADILISLIVALLVSRTFGTGPAVGSFIVCLIGIPIMVSQLID